MASISCVAGICHSVTNCAAVEPRATVGSTEANLRGKIAHVSGRHWFSSTSCVASARADVDYHVAVHAIRSSFPPSVSCSRYRHPSRLIGACFPPIGGRRVAGKVCVVADELRAGTAAADVLDLRSHHRLTQSSSSSSSSSSLSPSSSSSPSPSLSTSSLLLSSSLSCASSPPAAARLPAVGIGRGLSVQGALALPIRGGGGGGGGGGGIWEGVVIRSQPSLLTSRSRLGVSCSFKTVAMAIATDAPAPAEKEEEEEEVHAARENAETRRAKLSPGDALGPEYTQGSNFYNNDDRRAGVLLHPTSLPGPHGAGDFGPGAFAFLDWLKSTGCSIWQILPLVPPGRKSGEDGSPYAGQDANCGNTLLISLEKLVEYGLLEESELPPPVPVKRIDFEALAALKDPLIEKAATRLLLSDGALKDEYETFRASPNVSGWLEDAALFAAIDDVLNMQFWWDWPAELRDGEPAALDEIRTTKKEFIDRFCVQQFLFQKQWDEVHRYANEAGISVMGDMPIYVGGHSADVWAHRYLFTLDPETGAPVFVSGVPPDAFSATGQRWGSPLYDWAAMAEDNYSWWIQRMRRAFELYDEYRIDHFRAFAGYWKIPAEEETAMGGTWRMGPGIDFFNVVRSTLGDFKIVAEDLGVITKDVVDLRKAINAPGMSVLQFAFGGGPKNPHLPHNHETNQAVYPGTHDNDTVLGWYKRVEDWEREKASRYLHFDEKEDDVSWAFIRATLESVAQIAIIPMQDVMRLDNSARMNMPGVKTGNWGWRMGEVDVLQRTLCDEAKMFKDLVNMYNRLPLNHPAAKEEDKGKEEEEAGTADGSEKEKIDDSSAAAAAAAAEDDEGQRPILHADVLSGASEKSATSSG
ncbi:hypothetical protein CBR_g31505 [Chara braunii]|uniref:4-alpha-glucanotransferase n=1 Tax=Chara braunii TaxID=69332 RepID=A0A388LF69_CHABU|nr:hypothetical protein CBR_g31505 [Chara braunii]|eukprot:GBG80948.1 hypothetical protein CBR_g31505 [Chara braunii]